MTRGRKLLVAGLILACGLALAWPFRSAPGDSIYTLEETPTEVLRANNGDPIADAASLPAPGIPIAPAPVTAHAASTAESNSPGKTQRLESFDLANHPAIVNAKETAPPQSNSEVAQSQDGGSNDSRPVYSTADALPINAASAWPKELVHVVANGDTLEKLAERYLNDAGRTLEIFDLNRDQLTNPHLLPIGVELRVPVDPDRIID